MFKRKKQTELDIDVAIHDLHAFIKGENEGTDKYKSAVDDLAKLYKMKESLGTPDRVSKDTIITAAASVGSVALILIFEGVGRGIITSKSLGFAPKPKNKNH